MAQGSIGSPERPVFRIVLLGGLESKFSLETGMPYKLNLAWRPDISEHSMHINLDSSIANVPGSATLYTSDAR